jgi:uncharacterized protein
MRDIKPGEEVCFDYAMSDTTPYDEFECGCGSLNCRGHVGGNDWQKPELQKRYAGYFSPHVQRRIDALQSEKRAFEKAMRMANAQKFSAPMPLYE